LELDGNGAIVMRLSTASLSLRGRGNSPVGGGGDDRNETELFGVTSLLSSSVDLKVSVGFRTGSLKMLRRPLPLRAEESAPNLVSGAKPLTALEDAA
jgi:hypothetical protein